MSRDLSYRVWDEEKKEYSDKAFSLDQYGLLYVQDEDGYWEEASDRYIIEFTTGLEDKNGKRICEGDIVKKYDDGDIAPIIGVVEFYKYGARFAIGGGRNLLSQRWEVVGNIHKNSELLEN